MEHLIKTTSPPISGIAHRLLSNKLVSAKPSLTEWSKVMQVSSDVHLALGIPWCTWYQRLQVDGAPVETTGACLNELMRLFLINIQSPHLRLFSLLSRWNIFFKLIWCGAIIRFQWHLWTYPKQL